MNYNCYKKGKEHDKVLVMKSKEQDQVLRYKADKERNNEVGIFVKKYATKKVYLWKKYATRERNYEMLIKRRVTRLERVKEETILDTHRIRII